MKVYDFSKRELTEIPLITETSKFEFILNNNFITQIEEIPQTCSKLSLSNNKISFINSKFFSNLQLKYLDLSFNRIISLQGFEKFKLLEELNLSNNYIGDEQLNYLTYLTKLKTINLSNNNLRSEEVKNLIYKIKTLQKINLANNNIEQLIFEKSNGLIELDLDNNKISFLSFKCNSGNKFDFLMYLSANENRIQNVEGINNLINLEYLSLSVNEIREINIKKLNKLKYLQLKSNLLENFVINKSNQLLQYIDVSFNNINSFTIFGEYNALKNLILDNNKLSEINFGENKNLNQFNNNDINNNINKFKNLELLDISFNLITDIKFLILFKDVQKINISFNNIDNIIELLSMLRNFPKLKELNVIENEFNKNIYNTEILANKIFNNINDYFNCPNVNYIYKKQLISYRACILININNILCLDNINVSKEEKISALKLSEYKLDSIDLKSSNFSIYNNKIQDKFINVSSKENKININQYNKKKELNSNLDFNDLKVESSLSKGEDFNDENNNNEIDYSEYSSNNKNKYLYNFNNSNKKSINNKEQNKILKIPQKPKFYPNNNIINENSLDEIDDINTLTNTENNNNDINIQTYDIKPENDFFQKESPYKKINNRTIQNNKNPDIIPEEGKLKIYKMLCQTLYNLCDSKGYIYFKYFISLAEELVQEYNISPQLNEITKELKILIQSSLLPGKFHIKSLLKILQNNKYDTMYYIINEALKKKPNSIISQSIHLSQCIKKRVLKKEDDKENYENESDFHYNNFKISDISSNKEYAKSYDKYNNKRIIKNENSDINNNKYVNNNSDSNNQNIDSNINNNSNRNKNYKILNTLIMKTPLLSNYNNNKDQINNENTLNTNNSQETNQMNKGCFNILFQSSSELSKLPDLKNELFVQNFIYFINHISFPIHFNETEQSFIISISSQEKEFKFIQAFMSNFKMINFELNKWYCHNYYNQIFENYESYEFIFEHSLYIFYSYYNEIIDNFFNDVFQIQDCFLMIEDNPLNLFDQNTNSNTKIVMLALIQWKSDEDNNKNFENIVFNKNDTRYYFKNPFNWIGDNYGNVKNKNYKKKDNKNNNFSNKNSNSFNILIPVYIFSNIIFNDSDSSSFIKLYNNMNNKTF